MTTASLPPGKSRLVTPYRIVVSLLLAFAVAAMYVAFVSAKEARARHHGLAGHRRAPEREPDGGAAPGRASSPQLRPGYIGSLVVDGVEIPDDQLDHLEGVDTVGYTPGPGHGDGRAESGSPLRHGLLLARHRVPAPPRSPTSGAGRSN